MSVTKFRGAIESALVVALAFSGGAVARAQDEDAQADAKVIRIGPSDAQNEVPNCAGAGRVCGLNCRSTGSACSAGR